MVGWYLDDSIWLKLFLQFWMSFGVEFLNIGNQDAARGFQESREGDFVGTASAHKFVYCCAMVVLSSTFQPLVFCSFLRLIWFAAKVWTLFNWSDWSRLFLLFLLLRGI